MADTVKSSLYGITATFADGDVTVLNERGIYDSPVEMARERAAQLQAFLVLVSGEGAHRFESLADELRESLSHMAADMATELRVLCDLAAEVQATAGGNSNG